MSESTIPSAVDMKSLSIRELLEYFLNTYDPEAWDEFYRKICPVIAGTIARTLSFRDRRQAQDLEQEVFVQMIAGDYRRLRNIEWRSEDAVFRLAKVMARHIAIDWYRAAGKHVDVNIDDPAILGELFQECDCGGDAVIGDLWERIDRFLMGRASKPHHLRDWKIFCFFYRWSLTDKAIAALPGINLSPKKVENTRRQLLIEVRRELK